MNQQLTPEHLNLFGVPPIGRDEYESAAEVITQRIRRMFNDGNLSQGLTEVLWNAAVYHLADHDAFAEDVDIAEAAVEFAQMVGPVVLKAVGRTKNEPGTN